MKVQINATVQLPTLPRFLRGSQGAVDKRTIPVEVLTDDELRQLGQLWTEALVKFAQVRRRRPRS